MYGRNDSGKCLRGISKSIPEPPMAASEFLVGDLHAIDSSKRGITSGWMLDGLGGTTITNQ
jgi:hypothetical protein